MIYQLAFRPEAEKDLAALDNSQKLSVLKSLKRISEIGMQAGQPLSGKLAGCRKLKHKKLGLRVIFRQTEKGIEIIEIIAIGKREDKKVYRVAEKRIQDDSKNI